MNSKFKPFSLEKWFLVKTISSPTSLKTAASDGEQVEGSQNWGKEYILHQSDLILSSLCVRLEEGCKYKEEQ